MRDFLQNIQKIAKNIYQIILTAAFDFIMDNSLIAKYFPKSLDLAVKLKIVRNGGGDRIQGMDRLELAHALEYKNHIYYETHKKFPFMREFEASKRQNNTLLIFKKIAQNPSAYFINRDHWLAGSQAFLTPNLSECSCTNSGKFNRLKNQRRQSIQNKIITNYEKDFKDKKHEILNYLTLGPGGLANDTLIISDLMAKGAKKINVYLVEPSWFSKEDDKFMDSIKPSLQEFKDILNTIAHQNKVEIKFYEFSKIQSLSNSYPDIKIHIATAIDFDDLKI